MWCYRMEFTLKDVDTGEEIVVPTMEDMYRMFGVSNFIVRKAMDGERVLEKDGHYYDVMKVDKTNNFTGEKTKIPQLCWSCQNASHNGCSWARCLKPVEGWEAEAVVQYGELYTWHVLKCPLYVRD